MQKVSVALATYNGEKYIEKQLDSILSQHRLPDEVVIVDDCSTDHTVAIIKDFIEQNSVSFFRLYENEENIGFKENFKKALSLVTGDICFLCDQDDIWCEDKTETGMSIFADEKIMGIATGFSVIDEYENDISGEYLQKNYAFTREKFQKPLNNIPLESIMHSNISPGCTCAYRKKVIELFLQNADPEIPHDYQLNTVSSALSGFSFYNAPLTLYRIHPENTLGVKPLNQTRLEIAKEKLGLSEVVKDISQKGKALNLLCRRRYKAIAEKSILSAFLLWLIPEYSKYYSFKERIGDILYALGRKNG